MSFLFLLLSFFSFYSAANNPPIVMISAFTTWKRAHTYGENYSATLLNNFLNKKEEENPQENDVFKNYLHPSLKSERELIENYIKTHLHVKYVQHYLQDKGCSLEEIGGFSSDSLLSSNLPCLEGFLQEHQEKRDDNGNLVLESNLSQSPKMIEKKDLINIYHEGKLIFSVVPVLLPVLPFFAIGILEEAIERFSPDLLIMTGEGASSRLDLAATNSGFSSPFLQKLKATDFLKEVFPLSENNCTRKIEISLFTKTSKQHQVFCDLDVPTNAGKGTCGKLCSYFYTLSTQDKKIPPSLFFHVGDQDFTGDEVGDNHLYQKTILKIFTLWRERWPQKNN